ncbi:hypothetical protein EBU71_17570 [bacterium]|nr:hypothetical protein [Candidatus Elulimicrobium humile]
MFNPLLNDPASYKDADLDNKIVELSRKYHIAARSGQGQICQQISVILEALKDEQQHRRIKSLKDTKFNQNTDMDGLINIE